MDKNTFFQLLDKYQHGTATKAERALVEEYYRRLEAMAKTELSQEEEAALKEVMYRRILAGVRSGKNKVVPLWGRMYFRMAAAAVLLFLVSGIWFLVRTKEKRETDIVKQEQETPKDLPPGRDAAILTLADGKQILLDSATGTLGKHGNTTVINLNGLLTYVPSTKESEGEIAYHTITTSRGNQYQLVLSDGSRAWLNSASSLRFPTSFSGSQRIVELAGEGYFEVASSNSPGGRGKWPFIVNILPSTGGAGGGQVEVLGTHFNINAYNDESVIKTTLLEGSIKISRFTTHELPTGQAGSRLLKPGEQAQFGSAPSGEDILVEKNADIEKVMAWKSGFFEFDNTDLPTIMRQISRWYDIDVAYEGKQTKEEFGGRISKNLNLSGVLRLLETNGLKFKLEGKRLTVRQ